MRYYRLNHKQWSMLKNAMIAQGIYLTKNLRKVVEAIIMRLKTGVPWRYIHPKYGKWNSIYRAFRRWSQNKKILKIFEYIAQQLQKTTEHDNDDRSGIVCIDGSFVKAHQNSCTISNQQNEAIGKSRGGKTTKIHLATNGRGLPRKLLLTGGNINDSVMGIELLQGLFPRVVIGDKGYDSNEIRKAIISMGATPVIPRKDNSIVGNADMDWKLYKTRHVVENAFGWLKNYRAIATRYDKLKATYLSSVALGCCLMWLGKLL